MGTTMGTKLIRGAALIPPLYTFKLLWDKAGQPHFNNKSKTIKPCINQKGWQQRFDNMMRSNQDY